MNTINQITPKLNVHLHISKQIPTNSSTVPTTTTNAKALFVHLYNCCKLFNSFTKQLNTIPETRFISFVERIMCAIVPYMRSPTVYICNNVFYDGLWMNLLIYMYIYVENLKKPNFKYICVCICCYVSKAIVSFLSKLVHYSDKRIYICIFSLIFRHYFLKQAFFTVRSHHLPLHNTFTNYLIY